MIVHDALKIAREWVNNFACKETWFKGAYFSGSSIKREATSELPPHSDIDIMIVSSENAPSLKLGKFLYKDVLLEVSYLPVSLFSSAEAILGHYHLAYSFQQTEIISDPNHELRPLQQLVSRDFYQYQWVHKRCLDAKEKAENGLKNIPKDAPYHEQVMSWLFPTGVTTHMYLTAALQNPTVRLRYYAVKKVLMEYNKASLYEQLLQQLGCRNLSAEKVTHHLKELAITFDLTSQVAKTPFFFSSDLSKSARPISIDGSKSLINKGFHRESVFWLIATFCRCHIILNVDAPKLHEERFYAFEAVLSDLGIHSSIDLYSRAKATLLEMPNMWSDVLTILQQNPAITHSN
ncbi:hypothetical protein [Bacillus sp. JCM 19041]|uniref:hypothetical protein n=1 Tax=Bacillus sp. JCM 19041 TaxID=1460637 RepID=UPI0006D2130B